MRRGVYFLANDRVYDLAVAFLNSFRKHNPSIPLCLIPYKADIERLQGLQQKYKFSIFNNAEVLTRCDEISRHFHTQTNGNYRKLALWEGEFDEFLYIDVDMVVLADVKFVFRFLYEYDFVTSHSNMPEIVKWVWKPTIHATGKLTDEQIAYSANMGFIASKKGALTLDGVSKKIPGAVELIPHMVLLCIEQPLLNYLVVTSGKRHTSLSLLARTRPSPGVMFEFWAGGGGGVSKEGQILVNGRRAPILVVHWAGKWQPRFRDKVIFSVLRALRLSRSDRLAIRYFMPYKSLWRYYRYLSEEPAAQTGMAAAAATAGGANVRGTEPKL
jgi:hypothetical protein